MGCTKSLTKQWEELPCGFEFNGQATFSIVDKIIIAPNRPERPMLKGRFAMTAFSVFLQDRSLTPPQIRFIEMVIEQLTARGVMNAAALYESPFINLHAGGPEQLFAGNQNVIEGIFDTLRAVQPTTKATSGVL
jgi:hypothetical protein